MITLQSQLDSSINHIEENLKGFIESRYVRRSNEYFITYLSSQTGCNRGCRFCHLTTTKQTVFENVNSEQFLQQAHRIFDDYQNDSPAKTIHYNFMARGEPLCNPYLNDDVLFELGKYASHWNLFSKFNVSTILPRKTKPLDEIFKIVRPTIYYSLYSVNSDFRKKWIPDGMSCKDSFEILRDYQKKYKKVIKIHGAFIENQNDGFDYVNEIINWIKKFQLQVEFNIVRYNPFSILQGEETKRLTSIHQQFNEHFPTKIINRVGVDVFASCGTFYGGKSGISQN